MLTDENADEFPRDETKEDKAPILRVNNSRIRSHTSDDDALPRTRIAAGDTTKARHATGTPGSDESPITQSGPNPDGSFSAKIEDINDKVSAADESVTSNMAAPGDSAMMDDGKRTAENEPCDQPTEETTGENQQSGDVRSKARANSSTASRNKRKKKAKRKLTKPLNNSIKSSGSDPMKKNTPSRTSDTGTDFRQNFGSIKGVDSSDPKTKTPRFLANFASHVTERKGQLTDAEVGELANELNDGTGSRIRFNRSLKLTLVLFFPLLVIFAYTAFTVTFFAKEKLRADDSRNDVMRTLSLGNLLTSLAEERNAVAEKLTFNR